MLERIQNIHRQPLFALLGQARRVHLENNRSKPMRLCALANVKMGGCGEDCAYCAQSRRHSAGIRTTRWMTVRETAALAREGRRQGAVCMGISAAWRGTRLNHPDFQRLMDLIAAIRREKLRPCATLGNINLETAMALKQAGVDCYNHNLETSPEFFKKIITTHTFEDRLSTIRHIRKAGMALCCGGIIGMGEKTRDRLRLIEELAKLNPAPEGIPINCLMPISGTPLEKTPPMDPLDLIRFIATVRIVFPHSIVRLGAGRLGLSREAQALCFYAGANGIFIGRRLLTAANPAPDDDRRLLEKLALI
ncbi:MAG: biotin synthase BioB [Verrucomicrobiae bacterium]|nr:biotin synthase BioB [Verrucomicrobiae bacterium]